MRQGFNFYRSYYDIFKELPKKEKLEFIEALLDRQFTGKEPNLTGLTKFAYISQKHSIDKQVTGYERAKNEVLNKSSTPYGGSVGGSTGSPPKEGEVQEEVQVKEKAFIDWFNYSIKKVKGSGKYKLSGKVKSAFHARLKDGYTSDDFKKAFESMVKEPYHVDSNYKHITPEFLTRQEKLDKYVNAYRKPAKSGGVSMEEMYNAGNND